MRRAAVAVLITGLGPQTRLELLERSGSFSHVEEPDRVFALVREFTGAWEDELGMTVGASTTFPGRPGLAAGPAVGSRVGARSISMRVTDYSFGSVRVDGVTYRHDLIIDRGKIRKRDKAASRKLRGAYGHTPLSIAEDIPWQCRRLVIGTGADGALPVLPQIREEARRRNVDLVVLPTAQAVGMLTGAAADTNAILHLTC